jgi:hypothetical protein
MEEQPKSSKQSGFEFYSELETYRYLKGMGLPGVVFRSSGTGDSFLASTPPTGEIDTSS